MSLLGEGAFSRDDEAKLRLTAPLLGMAVGPTALLQMSLQLVLKIIFEIWRAD
ncbi:hypothetical protein [Rhizobium sp. L51/94]|uniref:hypothetical protein n=1 Tax=Rhizobium sp. L51/94 TaxID=2819999 RepID=UPI001C5ADF4A|nr:hypothetical protein [Rhizobium sp. L51/94]QXZ79676.1 hypothetical protein J5274_06750 [Rhizobium sp. L51/94]